MRKSRLEARQRAENERLRKARIALGCGNIFEQANILKFSDAARLPYRRQEILDALLYAIANASTRNLAESFEAAAMLLANHRPNLGRNDVKFPCSLDSTTASDFSSINFQTSLFLWKKQETKANIERRAILELTAKARLLNPFIQHFTKKLYARFFQIGAYSPMFPGYVEVKFETARWEASDELP